jgi:hypothetical protein
MIEKLIIIGDANKVELIDDDLFDLVQSLHDITFALMHLPNTEETKALINDNEKFIRTLEYVLNGN